MIDTKSIINSLNRAQRDILLLCKNETCPILSTPFKCWSIPQQIITESHLRPWFLFDLHIWCRPTPQLFVQPIQTRSSHTERDKPSSHLTSASPSSHHSADTTQLLVVESRSTCVGPGFDSQEAKTEDTVLSLQKSGGH